MSLRPEHRSGAGVPFLKQRLVGDEQAARRWLQDRLAEPDCVGGLVRELEWSPSFWEGVALFLDRVENRREVYWVAAEDYPAFGMEWTRGYYCPVGKSAVRKNL